MPTMHRDLGADGGLCKIVGATAPNPASSTCLAEVRHGCVRSETGWVTFQMNDQNTSLCHPSKGTLN